MSNGKMLFLTESVLKAAPRTPRLTEQTDTKPVRQGGHSGLRLARDFLARVLG